MANEPNWSAELWADINSAVVKEIAKVRVLQRIIPTRMLENDPTEILNDVIDLPSLTVTEGSTKPFIEIYREFALTSSQVAQEAEKWTCKTLARMAAKEIGLAEDSIFFQGTDAPLAGEMQAEQRESASHGLLGEANADQTFHVVPLGDPQRPEVVYGERTFAEVTKGIATLTEKGQAPHYALILPTAAYADTFVPPSPASLVTTAERIKPLVEGGYYGTGTLPDSKGLLVALGGEPTCLYVGREAEAEFVRKDGAKYVFRVVERVQFVARDARAFVLLIFDQP
jgi:uncharacterized linocin/CFP29 family protein